VSNTRAAASGAAQRDRASIRSHRISSLPGALASVIVAMSLRVTGASPPLRGFHLYDSPLFLESS
jgi:hypothetical protein